MWRSGTRHAEPYTNRRRHGQPHNRGDLDSIAYGIAHSFAVCSCYAEQHAKRPAGDGNRSCHSRCVRVAWRIGIARCGRIEDAGSCCNWPSQPAGT